MKSDHAKGHESHFKANVCDYVWKSVPKTRLI